MKFRFNLLSVFLLFFIGVVLAAPAQYHHDEAAGNASLQAGRIAEQNKVTSANDASASHRQANAATRMGRQEERHAEAAYRYRDYRAEQQHGQAAATHIRNAAVHQQNANTHSSNAAAYQQQARTHYRNAAVSYQHAINGRVNTANQYYGGTYDHGHNKAIQVVQGKLAQAQAGVNRN